MGPVVGYDADLTFFHVQKERMLVKLVLIKKMLSMWSNNGEQESDSLAYTRV